MVSNKHIYICTIPRYICQGGLPSAIGCYVTAGIFLTVIKCILMNFNLILMNVYNGPRQILINGDVPDYRRTLTYDFD